MLWGQPFQLRFRTPSVAPFSSICCLPQGIPQESALRTLLWLIFFNPPCPTLRSGREALGLDVEHHHDLLHADDSAVSGRAGSLVRLAELARLNVEPGCRVLASSRLQLNDRKTQNIVFDPFFLPRGVFRRENSPSAQTTKRRLCRSRNVGGAAGQKFFGMWPGVRTA